MIWLTVNSRERLECEDVLVIEIPESMDKV